MMRLQLQILTFSDLKIFEVVEAIWYDSEIGIPQDVQIFKSIIIVVKHLL